jgi:hypothetical protein
VPAQALELDTVGESAIRRSDYIGQRGRMRTFFMGLMPAIFANAQATEIFMDR